VFLRARREVNEGYVDRFALGATEVLYLAEANLNPFLPSGVDKLHEELVIRDSLVILHSKQLYDYMSICNRGPTIYNKPGSDRLKDRRANVL